ncbi:MAG: hypothetical protein QW478_01545 [Candidatus Micrarchaeaceae archaeon]
MILDDNLIHMDKDKIFKPGINIDNLEKILIGNKIDNRTNIDLIQLDDNKINYEELMKKDKPQDSDVPKFIQSQDLIEKYFYQEEKKELISSIKRRLRRLKELVPDLIKDPFEHLSLNDLVLKFDKYEKLCYKHFKAKFEDLISLFPKEKLEIPDDSLPVEDYILYYMDTEKRIRKKFNDRILLYKELNKKVDIKPIDESTPIEEVEKQFKIIEAKLRSIYRIKYSILQEAYPKMSIPEIKEDESIEQIDAQHKIYIKKIAIDASTDDNVNYLIFLWVIIQVIAKYVIKIPIDGYASSQMKKIHKYKHLLIELGEETYESTQSTWSVQMRILFLSGFHLLIFCMMKFLLNYTEDSKGIQNLIDQIEAYLLRSRSEEILQRVENVNEDTPIELGESQGTGMGNLLSGFLDLLGAFNAPKTGSQPNIKKPTGFASRFKKNN